MGVCARRVIISCSEPSNAGTISLNEFDQTPSGRLSKMDAPR
jgi:hypothetical protein